LRQWWRGNSIELLRGIEVVKGVVSSTGPERQCWRLRVVERWRWRSSEEEKTV
jgi:hypothetical protein